MLERVVQIPVRSLLISTSISDFTPISYSLSGILHLRHLLPQAQDPSSRPTASVQRTYIFPTDGPKLPSASACHTSRLSPVAACTQRHGTRPPLSPLCLGPRQQSHPQLSQPNQRPSYPAPGQRSCSAIRRYKPLIHLPRHHPSAPNCPSLEPPVTLLATPLLPPAPLHSP